MMQQAEACSNLVLSGPAMYGRPQLAARLLTDQPRWITNNVYALAPGYVWGVRFVGERELYLPDVYPMPDPAANFPYGFDVAGS